VFKPDGSLAVFKQAKMSDQGIQTNTVTSVSLSNNKKV